MGRGCRRSLDFVSPALSAGPLRKRRTERSTYCNQRIDEGGTTVRNRSGTGLGSGAARSPAAAPARAATTAASTPTTPRRWPARPPPLAALHRQANQLLPGGGRRLRTADRGARAATRSWSTSGPPGAGPAASSSPPCRSSPPTYGKQVAFLGVDSQDSDDAAETFLAEAPRPLPQLHRPRRRHRRAASAPRLGLPDTAFYDRQRQARLPQAGPLHRPRRTAGRRRALRARLDRLRKRIIERMDAFVVIALIGIALLLAELLLPTGGVLGGARRARPDRRRRARARIRQRRRRLRRPGADHARRALRSSAFYFVTRKVLEAHRDEPVRTGSEEMVGSRRRGPQHARPRGPGLDRRGRSGGAAGRRRRPARPRG